MINLTFLPKILIKDAVITDFFCRDGRFLIGDEIINVNGASLRGVTMEEARHILGTCGPEIDIIVARELQESVRTGAQVRYPDNLLKLAKLACKTSQHLSSIPDDWILIYHFPEQGSCWGEAEQQPGGGEAQASQAPGD